MRKAICLLGVVVSVMAMVFHADRSWAMTYDAAFYQTITSGGIVVEDAGSSFLVHSYISQSPDQVYRAFSSDLKKLKGTISGVGTVMSYVDQNNKKMLYVKVRGFGKTEGVLLEVLGGGDEAFKDHKANANLTCGPGKAIARDYVSWKVNADKESREAASSTTQPVATTLKLRGPINEIMNLNATIFTIELTFNKLGAASPPAPVAPQPVPIGPVLVKDLLKAPEVKVGDSSGTHFIVQVTPEFRTPREEVAIWNPFDSKKSALAKRYLSAVVADFAKSFGKGKKGETLIK